MTRRSQEIVLAARRIHTGSSSFAEGAIALDPASGTIVRIWQGAAGSGALHLGERIVAPGFVDVHVHGGLGVEVNGDEPDAVSEAVDTISRHHARHGTTSLLATTVSDSHDRLRASLAGIAAAVARGPGGGARVVGAHLEGPFLSLHRAGAQEPASLRAPDLRELDRLESAAHGTLRLITLAPELPGALELIEHAQAAGIIVSLGHSDADYDTAQRAFRAGARHVTHLFNAMAPLHHRRPGLLAAALEERLATVELVADLEHVHPAILQLTSQVAGDRVVAVTDAMAACGLGEGTWRLGSQEVSVKSGRAVLAASPETLAGSLLTMDAAVRNLAGPAGFGADAAIRAATGAPGRLLGRGGRLAPGDPADLVVLEPDLSLVATVVGGVAVHDPEELFAA